MKELAQKIYSSKKFKLVVPILIVLITGLYLSFFSPKADGNNSAIIEQSEKPTTIVTNDNSKTQNSALKAEDVTLLEKDTKALEDTSISPSVALTDSLAGNNKIEVSEENKTETSTQEEPKKLLTKATPPNSRGTSPQKQAVATVPTEKPIENSPKQESSIPEKGITPEAGSQALEKDPKDTVNTKENESINPELFKQDLNSYVLAIIKTYEIGKYPYLLNTDYKNYNGVTTNINYQGSTIAKANPNGDRASHCVGITFEVFFKAMQERNKKLAISPDDFNGMSADDLRSFMLNWFVSDGVKPQQNCSVAIEKYGLGKRIYNLEDAKPGDFIDISRENNTGHTAVFLNWIKEDGKIIGLKYWSSQLSTNGIAYKEEYFNVTDSNGKKYGNVMFNQIYIGRVGAVNDYKSFR